MFEKHKQTKAKISREARRIFFKALPRVSILSLKSYKSIHLEYEIKCAERNEAQRRFEKTVKLQWHVKFSFSMCIFIHPFHF